MNSRLLSFLSDFEHALLSDDPTPDGGKWIAERAVNYSVGLARLILRVSKTDNSSKLRGSILLQSFKLADGSACLKLQLGWADTETTVTHAVFAKPGCDWKSEARRLAAQWMGGSPSETKVDIKGIPDASVEEADVAVEEPAAVAG